MGASYKDCNALREVLTLAHQPKILYFEQSKLKFSSLHHDHTINPITALEFYQCPSTSNKLILVGEGCYLKIFEVMTSMLLLQIKVFDDQAIHGIKVRDNIDVGNFDTDLDVAIWGGSCLAIFEHKNFTKMLDSANDRSKISSFQNELDPYYSINASDWILDGLISHRGECVLVTTHNTLLRTKIEEGFLSLEPLSSPSRSILYSARLVYESEDSLLVAAGTVFGEIIVWRCSDAMSHGNHILHTFKGHEGSIFGVDISPMVVGSEGNPTRLVASCSDDRTIRIWELNLGSLGEFSSPEALAESETGFGGEGQHESLNKCVATVMGHASRIWSVQFLARNRHITLLSFGEDATTQYWTLENSEFVPFPAVARIVRVREQAKLKHRSTFAFHSGKHIFSSAILEKNNGSILVATGGADGKMSLFEIHKFGASQSHSWDSEEVLRCLSIRSTRVETPIDQNRISSKSSPSPSTYQSSNSNPKSIALEKPAKNAISGSQTGSKDSFHKYAFVSEKQVLVTMTSGRILLLDIEPCIKWTEVYLPGGSNDLRSYSVVKGISEIGSAFLGSANGRIFFYRSGTVHQFGKIEGKVADMFTIHDYSIELLATTLGGTSATLFKCLVQEAVNTNFKSLESQRLKLLDKFIVTSAGTVSGRLVLGARYGTLAIYNTQCDEPVCTWSPICPGDAVTSILNLSESRRDPNVDFFLTTRRDGTYSIFRFSDSITMIHQAKPPVGPMIETAWFSDTDLILCGFKSTKFVVWNETKQYEISSVECGGAHRSYAYSPIAGGGGAGHFVYTKASRSYFHSQNKPSHQIVKYGGHGREIKASAISPNGLIATGAEDTTIRIWRYQDSDRPTEKQFRCLSVIQKHTTGIQHLQWHSSSYLFSSGGNEEFFVWAVEMIPGFGIALVCEASCPDQSEEQDLRIISFDVSSMPISDDGLQKLLISLAFSDSTIRIYTYSRMEKFNLVAEGKYTSSCLMHVCHLKIERELFFLTAGTDGYLTIWKTAFSILSGSDEKKQMTHSEKEAVLESDSSPEAEKSGFNHPKEARNLKRTRFGRESSRVSKLVMLSNQRLHQNSIKSLDIAIKDSKIIVATGGDDNALGVAVYQANDLSRKPARVVVMSAHAAAITGLSFVSTVSSEGGAETRVVTSSNDQRIKEWVLNIGLDNASNHPDLLAGVVGIRKVGDIFTSVADVGNLTRLNGTEHNQVKKILVVGNGMEVYEVSL